MPHYKNGAEAKVGDIVRGPITYPEKKVIEGIVTALQPSEFCNMSVAYLTTYKVWNQESPNMSVQGVLYRDSEGDLKVVTVAQQTAVMCKDFEKVE